METNQNKQFSNLEYRLIEEFNTESECDSDNIPENDITYKAPDKLPEVMDESLYNSAKELDNFHENLQLNIKNKSSKTQQSKKNPLLNATMYNKKDPEDHDNKFVDGSTLNSYLSISDLKQDTKDNVDILRSNISKLDF